MPILRLAITLPLPRHPDGVPRLPSLERNAFLSLRVIHTWFDRHTRASKTREGRGGRFIALERLGYYLRTALREFILSFAYAKFEIPVCNASSRVILDDNFNFVETFRDCGDLAIVESGKWHFARTLGYIYFFRYQSIDRTSGINHVSTFERRTISYICFFSYLNRIQAVQDFADNIPKVSRAMFARVQRFLTCLIRRETTFEE